MARGLAAQSPQGYAHFVGVRCTPPLTHRRLNFFELQRSGFDSLEKSYFWQKKHLVACSRSPEFRIGIAEGRTVDVLPKKRAASTA